MIKLAKLPNTNLNLRELELSPCYLTRSPVGSSGTVMK